MNLGEHTSTILAQLYSLKNSFYKYMNCFEVNVNEKWQNCDIQNFNCIDDDESVFIKINCNEFIFISFLYGHTSILRSTLK